MSYPKYGNIKMKGKIEKHLSCRCCVAVNWKKVPRATEEDLQKLEKSAKIYKSHKHYPTLKE